MNYKSTGVALTALGLGLISNVSATNGVNMIGIGPNSRALGGTGIAAPQDAVSAVFSNPAAMCVSENCAQPQLDVSFTSFMPNVKAKLQTPGGILSAKSDSDFFLIPAIGFSQPIGDNGRLRAGFAIYGTSGLGVDYTGTALGDNVPFNYTELAIMKIAPSVSYMVTPEFSIGASVHVNYSTLEVGKSPKAMFPDGHGGYYPPFAGMGKDDDSDWSVGIQLGATWKVSDCVTLGATYTSAQKSTFNNVMAGVDPTTGMGVLDPAFDLESPQQAGVGIAWVGMKDRLTLFGDIKWVNWSDAAGYSDFGWDDQWVFAVGAQYELIEDKLMVRAGYNYAKSPVDSADMMTDMGGLIGFPAIVEHHMSLGLGYMINENFTANLSWVHAFENTVKSDSVPGLESTMYQDAIDIGLTWRY